MHQHLAVQTPVAFVHERIALLAAGTFFSLVNPLHLPELVTGNVDSGARLVHVVPPVDLQQRNLIRRIGIPPLKRIHATGDGTPPAETGLTGRTGAATNSTAPTGEVITEIRFDAPRLARYDRGRGIRERQIDVLGAAGIFGVFGFGTQQGRCFT